MEKETSMISIKPQKYILFFALIIIALLIEVVVCNYPAFRTLFIGNNNLTVEYQFEDNKIFISDIGVRATSINFEYENELTEIITYKLSFLAKEDDAKVELREKAILPNENHYIQFDTHSMCKEIEVELKTDSNINLKNITINKPNFNMNFVRVLFIFGIGLLISKLKDEDSWKKLYDSDSKEQQWKFVIVLIIFCIIIAIYTIKQYELPVRLFSKEKIGTYDTLLLQTEAFMREQTTLPIRPSSKLMDLEDPYNYTKKVEEDIDFLFDTAYYDGAYYSYFGVTPILILILPIRAITGKYIDTHVLNLVFVFGILFLLYDVYRKLIKKYVKKVSLCSFYLGYFALIMGSDILFTLRGQRYDIVVTSGIMFILLSISLAIRIGENNRFRALKYTGLGISMALIVLSKPTFILYYPLIIFFLWTSMNFLEKKEKIKSSMLIGIPLAIFAVGQMIYNYERFDNPFEFGAKYQFTAFNMLYSMSFSFVKIYEGIIDCIFRMPSINLLKFPFIILSKDVSNVMLNEVLYENRSVGMMAIPIFWIFLFKKFIIDKETREDKEFKKIINISLITTLVLIIINSCIAGICNLYTVDFKCILAINAVILLLKKLDKDQHTKEANYKFTLLCISTICIMIPISFSTGVFMLEDFESIVTVYLKNIFEFWC